MEAKVIKYKAQKFSELSDEAKEKALEVMRDINVSFEWWDSDCYLELSEKEMKARHIKLSPRWWEKGLGNIPGEYPAYTGLFRWRDIYFDIDRSWYLQFQDLEVRDENIFRRWLRIPKQLWDNCSYSFTNPGRYGNTRLEIEPMERDWTPHQGEIIERAEAIFADKVSEALRILRDDYYYLLSDKAVQETIEINDYDFFEDGRRCMKVCA
jgi:hypothetical protein